MKNNGYRERNDFAKAEKFKLFGIIGMSILAVLGAVAGALVAFLGKKK